jgi:hypothetical protein
MSKLYVIMEGLIGVTTPTKGNPMVLLVKTYSTDRDGKGQPLMQHFPKVAFRTGGQPITKELNGEDIRFDTGQPNAPLGKDFSRIPPFSKILAFAPASNGGQRGAKAQINAGCIGGVPGTACLVPGQPNPRLAGRVLIDHGKLTSIQVGEDGNPTKDSPTTFRFEFEIDSNGPALEMPCDNALLLKIDSGASPIKMIVGQESRRGREVGGESYPGRSRRGLRHRPRHRHGRPGDGTPDADGQKRRRSLSDSFRPGARLQGVQSHSLCGTRRERRRSPEPLYPAPHLKS